jgi:tetratricopeptide (TPR) repeat protein
MLKSAFFIFLLVQICTIAHAASAPWVGSTLNEAPCNGGGQGYGPFDYRHRRSLKNELNLVESAHFTPEIENLVKGTVAGSIEGNLNYTLRAWPNHPKALLSLIRLQLSINKNLRKGPLETPPECYLQRAIHFSPEDASSYSLYGYYLKQIGHLEDAAKYYEKAAKLSPKDPKIAYSLSLLLTDLKRYEEAVKYAKVAYSNPQAPQKLKQILKKLGVWVE